MPAAGPVIKAVLAAASVVGAVFDCGGQGVRRANQ